MERAPTKKTRRRIDAALGRRYLDGGRVPRELGKVKRDDAGIADRTSHDLRGTGMLMPNMAGCAEAEAALYATPMAA